MSTTTITGTLTGDYVIDPTHTRIGFVARHAMVTKVRGSFNEFEGTAYFDADNPASSHSRSRSRPPASTRATSSGTATCAATTSSTRRPTRDHFVTTAVVQLDDDDVPVTGDLTIKDVTKPVTSTSSTAAPRRPVRQRPRRLRGPHRVNRKDWGVNWNAALEAGGVLVSEKVTLEFDISAVKVQHAA